jgi:hypothetical protein
LKPGSVVWWILAVAGLLLFIPAAWLGSQSPAWLALFVPLLLLWSVWLIRDYMLWYRQLGAGGQPKDSVQSSDRPPNR